MSKNEGFSFLPIWLSELVMAAMLSVRSLILTFGPLMLIGGAYWLAMPHDAQGRSEQQANLDEAVSVVEPRSTHQESLGEACRQTANQLRPRLNADCRAIVRVPFVLAGNLTKQKLAQHYRETIAPTVRALSISYFDQKAS